ncbi:hypothetical protein [Teredinibacter sp. KSP-S5-2]|uniref:hypothetical protein n=1 Tax=Teredinibacter sp. KSP-S5-2 TaxID=3034506 RepID=UPI00293526E0|nr:hypothetical protein [Teredinibacter sp. KSP-S5-2]WNO09144.1 hypothetical protein P5V12_19570 [Teredinibacter sp. KSP-S5-2]
MIKQILIVNWQALLIAFVSVFILFKANIRNRAVAIVGLVLIGLTGVIGVAGVMVSELYWPAHFSSTIIGIYSLVNIASAFNSIGLILVVYCLYKQGANA